MIRKVKGEFVAECDDCGDEYPGGVEDDWQAFIDEIMAARGGE